LFVAVTVVTGAIVVVIRHLTLRHCYGCYVRYLRLGCFWLTLLLFVTRFVDYRYRFVGVPLPLRVFTVVRSGRYRYRLPVVLRCSLRYRLVVVRLPLVTFTFGYRSLRLLPVGFPAVLRLVTTAGITFHGSPLFARCVTLRYSVLSAVALPLPAVTLVVTITRTLLP